MPDYSKGKIYTIRCLTDDNLIYVGSTIQPLSSRRYEHKKNCEYEQYKNYLLYKTINHNWENWYLELYEYYPCKSKEELLRREGEVIREIGTLNKKIAGRTNEEYLNDNRDIINEKHRKKIICECGSIGNIGNLLRHKQSKKHINFIKKVPVQTAYDTPCIPLINLV
jgi:hypothetical protein